MKEGNHERGEKVAFSMHQGGTTNGTDQVPVFAEPDLRAVMNARGVEILRALGRQMDKHLRSLEVFQGATHTLACHSSYMVLEIGKLLEAIQHYQATHAEVLAEAELLRRIIGEFAQHVHNTRSFATK